MPDFQSQSIPSNDHRASISRSPALAQPTGDVQFEIPQSANPLNTGSLSPKRLERSEAVERLERLERASVF
jgi:hypothetical protein